jgi:putative transposase
MAMGIQVCERTVSVLMTQAGIYGLPGPTRIKQLRGVVTADDLVNRKFHRIGPNELWATSITQHRTGRDGSTVARCSTRSTAESSAGRSTHAKTPLWSSTRSIWREMAIRNRRPGPGGIVHADHGTQFTSWAFGEKIRSAGLLPSFGTVGDGLDNVMMESFWSSMQIELLNRKRWRTRVELANAIFEYIEIFHNRQRRHSAFGYPAPIEYELLSEKNPIPVVS